MHLSSRLAIRITGALIAVTFLATASLLGAIYYFGVRLPMDDVRDKVRREAQQLERIYVQKGEVALTGGVCDAPAISSLPYRGTTAS